LIWTQAAGGCPHPAASRRRAEHALKLARSERPSERQVRLCPSKAERCTQDTGAAQAAVPIDID